MKWAVLTPGLAVLLGGCVGISAKKHTYSSMGGTAELGGATVGVQFRPEGTKGPNMMLSAMVVGGGFATFDGPFRWRIEALGESGVQEKLIVHRIRTKTSKTNRDEWYPEEHLGFSKAFRRVKGEPGVSRVRYEIPGLLKVKPEEDGRLDVWIDMSVIERVGTTRKILRFALDPDTKRADEMVFLPVEVAKSIGSNPEDWEDSMWD
ncbi:hypothetical protein ACFQY0_02780 [Haloferula chungangensis]|uniref:Lipoprotein n=1 Tax=Haloferula chungangensis TaxID=1048331 RepID=A0ABW2L173_9BACT